MPIKKTTWALMLHQLEWPSSKILQTINAGQEMGKREASCTVGGNINGYSQLG